MTVVDIQKTKDTKKKTEDGSERQYERKRKLHKKMRKYKEKKDVMKKLKKMGSVNELERQKTKDKRKKNRKW